MTRFRSTAGRTGAAVHRHGSGPWDFWPPSDSFADTGASVRLDRDPSAERRGFAVSPVVAMAGGSPSPMPADRRVLVVDDDAIIRDSLADALTDEGYSVRVAGNGIEALAATRDWRPDVILLDLMMPGMDGWAFRARQRQTDTIADVPVIVMSALVHLSDRIDELEAAAILHKPFDLEALLHTVSMLAAIGADDAGKR